MSRMAEKELKKIKERAENAIRKCTDFSYQTFYDSDGDPDFYRIVCRNEDYEAWIGEVYAKDDAEFLTNAYTDVPRLVNALEEAYEREHILVRALRSALGRATVFHKAGKSSRPTHSAVAACSWIAEELSEILKELGYGEGVE